MNVSLFLLSDVHFSKHVDAYLQEHDVLLTKVDLFFYHGMNE